MKRTELFPVLDPPPFGLTKMKSKVAQATWYFRLRVASIASMAAVLMVAAWALSRQPDFRNELSRLPSGALLGLSTFPAGVTLTLTAEGAVLRVESVNPSVLFYRIAMTENTGNEEKQK